MLRAAPAPLENDVSKQPPKIEPSSEGDEGAQTSSGPLSKRTLVVALIIMLLPAGVPLYFALRIEGGGAIWFFALAGAVALVNIVLVIGIWSWINSQSAG